MQRTHPLNIKKHGFTLIELAMVTMVVSLVIASVMTMENQKIRRAKIAETADKMQVIEKALYSYRLVNNKLPCPGNAALAMTHTNFGFEANGGPESCHTGGTINSNINSSGNNVFGGTLPVRTLGIPDEYALDGWGNYLTYYVDKAATKASNFTAAGTGGVTPSGSLTVKDESDTAISANTLIAIVSHGPNGAGAYSASGTRRALPTGSVEIGNTLCSNSECNSNTSTAAVRVGRTTASLSTDASQNTDDIVTYFPRSRFYTYAEKHQN